MNGTNQVVDNTIALRKRLKIRIPDAIIAATALSEKLILVTRNSQDFTGIPELIIINPWKT